MAKIPFSIDYRPQIESGEYKVETKNGVSVRIIFWDARGSNDRKDIIGLTNSIFGSENLQRYDIIGHLIADSARIGNKDLLIITPEPELTEFEKAVKNMMSPYVKMPDEIHKEKAAKLLELARKELAPTFGAEYMNGYEDGVNYGRAEALKDLPRWKKVALDTRQTTLVVGYTKDEDKLYRNGYVISLSDLEKLPGFKED